jgi:hypothetical protein
VAFYLLVAVTLAAARKGLIGREGESLQPGARMSGLVTLGSGLAVVLCYAAVPYVSDPVGAVQPLAGGYLVCYRNFIRVGLGRMTIHLFPFAVLFVAGLLDGLGRGPGEVTGS